MHGLDQIVAMNERAVTGEPRPPLRKTSRTRPEPAEAYIALVGDCCHPSMIAVAASEPGAYDAIARHVAEEIAEEWDWSVAPFMDYGDPEDDAWRSKAAEARVEVAPVA